jgi:histidinol-phosphate aminotransferase
LEAVRIAGASSLSRYPDLYSEPLRNQLLDYVGLTGDTFSAVTGCGSDDVLDSTMRAFSSTDATIAFSAPTFTMIPVLARLNGLRPISIPFTESFDIDAQQLVDAQATITYLCTPNNPTASPVSRAAVDFVVDNARGVVVIDEAYAEFAPEQFVDLIRRSDRVLVARTFSKAFGLAGLRIGFGVGSRELTRLVARARGPYKVTSVAERVAEAVLQPGDGARDWVLRHAALAVEHRERFTAELTRRGLDVLPSAANFVLVPMADATRVSKELISRGILVRVISGLPDAPSRLARGRGLGLRIGVGPWEMMQPLLDALDAVLS